MKALVAGAALALLAACSDDAVDEAAPTPTSEPSIAVEPVPPPPAPVGPTPEDLAVLESRDCTAVVQGFAGAVRRKALTFADLFWMPDAEGKAGFDSLVQGLASPVLTLGAMTQEGAAGSLFCTVEVSLADASAPATAPTSATLVLRRVNDVDGATPQQLRWTIRSAALAPNDPAAY
ncbi:MAG: hypothetical protein ABIT10_10125 [Alteraurantiacibacter sp.]